MPEPMLPPQPCPHCGNHYPFASHSLAQHVMHCDENPTAEHGEWTYFYSATYPSTGDYDVRRCYECPDYEEVM